MSFDDLSLMTRVTRGELIHIFESIFESKELIVDPCLMRPLDKLLSMSMLKDHGCRRVQQLHMDRLICWDDTLEHRVFLIRPSIKTARKICELVKASPNWRYSIIFVDKRSLLFDRELERNGLFGLIGAFEFSMSLIQLESDLFSLELPSSSSDRDGSSYMAKTLWRLQSLYGLIPTSLCIGERTKVIDKHFRKISSELGEPSATAEQPISHMFLFDRSLDLVTPLMTCLTYESMLNDKFEYWCGKIVLGESIEAKLRKNNNTTNRIFPLNNSDAIFSSIRNLHMTAVFSFLSAKSKDLQSSFDRVSNLKKVEDMKAFVANELQGLQNQKEQLEMHICACEDILASTSAIRDRFTLEQSLVRRLLTDTETFTRINNLIAAGINAEDMLQLTCLWSICCNGIPSKLLTKLKEIFLRKYGYHHLPEIYRLKTKNIIFERPTTISSIESVVRVGKSISGPSVILPHMAKTLKQSKPMFSSMCATLTLCPPADEISEQNKKIEKSVGYIFSDAYIPLISRVVEITVSEGWENVSSKLKRIFGDTTPIFSTNPSPARPDNRVRKAIFVCFAAGVTYAEIASLRRFAQENDFRIIIITTNIINRKEFIQNIATD